MSQNLYRALYQTRTGTVRRMTFAHSGGIKAAHRFAESWQIEGANGDKLIGVATVRPLARPEFQLQSNLSGV